MFGRSGRGRSVATCFKPTISVQNLCDSSMSRTFSTRWLMPEGLTASAGAGGTSEILSVITSAPKTRLVYVVPPRNGSRKSSRQAAKGKPAVEHARLAAVKAVFLVVMALVVQRPAANVKLALLGIETALLATISPLALLIAPVIGAISGRRLAIHRPADPLYDVARSLRVRRQHAQRQERRQGQYS